MKNVVLIICFSLLTACGGSGSSDPAPVDNDAASTPPDNTAPVDNDAASTPPDNTAPVDNDVASTPPDNTAPVDNDVASTPPDNTAPDNTITDRFDFIVQSEPTNLLDSQVDVELEGAFQRLADELNETYGLPDRKVTIILRDCGAINAFYDAVNSEVIMCRELLADTVRWGISQVLDDELGTLYGVYAFLYTFSHELGHTFVDHYNIPVSIGMSEQLADEIGAILMLRNDITREDALAVFEGGAYLGSHPTAYLDIHPTPANRYIDLFCLAYGAYPQLANEDNVLILATVAEFANQGRDCGPFYVSALDATESYFAPYLK